MEIPEFIIRAIAVVLIMAGTFFTFLAGLGIVRMPDVYTRMHASTKAASLGAGLMLTAAAIYFGEIGVTTRVALTVIFIFLTAPVAAHMLGRSAYLMRVKQWEGSIVDEARDKLTLDDAGEGDPNAESDRSGGLPKPPAERV